MGELLPVIYGTVRPPTYRATSTPSFFCPLRYLPSEPLVMKPLRGKTDFQGLYSLISFRYEAKGFRAELILIAGRFA
jgi:hypothetical protein